MAKRISKLRDSYDLLHLNFTTIQPSTFLGFVQNRLENTSKICTFRIKRLRDSPRSIILVMFHLKRYKLPTRSARLANRCVFSTFYSKSGERLAYFDVLEESRRLSRILSSKTTLLQKLQFLHSPGGRNDSTAVPPKDWNDSIDVELAQLEHTG